MSEDSTFPRSIFERLQQRERDHVITRDEMDQLAALRAEIGNAGMSMPKPPPDTPDRLAVMAAVERGVRSAFERRYAGRTMTYEQARELVWMERDLVENIGFAVQHFTGEST